MGNRYVLGFPMMMAVDPTLSAHRQRSHQISMTSSNDSGKF